MRIQILNRAKKQEKHFHLNNESLITSRGMSFGLANKIEWEGSLSLALKIISDFLPLLLVTIRDQQEQLEGIWVV